MFVWPKVDVETFACMLHVVVEIKTSFILTSVDGVVGDGTDMGADNGDNKERMMPAV